MSNLLQLYLQFAGATLLTQILVWFRYRRPKVTLRLLGLVLLAVVFWPWYAGGMVLDLWRRSIRWFFYHLTEQGMGRPAIFDGGMLGIAVSIEPPSDEARWRPEDDEESGPPAEPPRPVVHDLDIELAEPVGPERLVTANCTCGRWTSGEALPREQIVALWREHTELATAAEREARQRAT